MKLVSPSLVLRVVAVFALGSPGAALANACLVTPAELQTATGRAFSSGQESKAVDGSPLCIYAETDAPQRKLTVNVIASRGKAAYDSRMRMLQMGKKSIDLKGVGDAAYFTGPAAGVLTGDTLITFSNVQRAGSKEPIPSERIVALLKAALGRYSP